MKAFLTKTFIGLPMYAWLIGGAVTLGAILYFTRARASTSPSSTASSGAGTPVPVPFAVSTNGATGNPSANQLGSINLRSKRDNGWDRPSGPPVFIDPNQPFDTSGNPKSVGNIPFGSTVAVTGPSRQGGSIAGQTTYYPVSTAGGGTGYISAADVLGWIGANSSSSVGGAGGAAESTFAPTNAMAPIWTASQAFGAVTANDRT